jgi:hypothetical protein
MSISRNKEMALIIGSAVVSTFALAGTAFAAGNPIEPTAGGHMNFARPAVVGTVSAVNGDILTVASNSWSGRKGVTPSTTSASQPVATAKVSTTYTVDATNATVTKSNAASTVASIAVGDTVMVQGTVTGTDTVTATTIRDGVMRGGMKPATGKGAAQMPPGITGNGEPVVGGNVTAISGSTLTVTNKSNVTYTIDATNAIVMKGNATSTLSNVATGDNVVVQGTVTGSSVTASTVIDQGAPQTTSGGVVHSFMGAIGGFFTRVFGFF